MVFHNLLHEQWAYIHAYLWLNHKRLMHSGRPTMAKNSMSCHFARVLASFFKALSRNTTSSQSITSHSLPTWHLACPGNYMVIVTLSSYFRLVINGSSVPHSLFKHTMETSYYNNTYSHLDFHVTIDGIPHVQYWISCYYHMSFQHVHKSSSCILFQTTDYSYRHDCACQTWSI